MKEPVSRALLSVFDKEGLLPLARRLVDAGVEIVSSGGTARLLRENDIPVLAVSDLTGFPEMLGGRVKTLHPAVHGGILAVRSDPQHMTDLKAQGFGPIDLVVVNLYPFTKTASTPGVAEREAVEMIDIGGPAMVRAAAKNFGDVAVVVDPTDYDEVGAAIEAKQPIGAELRRRLAVKAFRHTADYDAAVSTYLAGHVDSEEGDGATETVFAERLHVDFHKVQDLRYGENPHQRAAFYRDPLACGPTLGSAEQLQGKELSFNNILDLDAALGLAADFTEPACAIIKHGNPCGAAVARELQAAFDAAVACDPVSAFGGVIAFNRPVDLSTADTVAETFFEAIVAPGFDADARERLARKKKLRLLSLADLGGFRREGFDLRRVQGGLLAQDWDGPAGDGEGSVRDGKVVTDRSPTEDEWRGLDFAWTVCRHVKSNAIVYAGTDRTLGVGAGQMSRVDSAKIAVDKAQHSLEGAVMASDAFFPFRDGLDVGAKAGIKAVVQPGGSIRDDEVIAAANEQGIAMVFTGRRHFRH